MVNNNAIWKYSMFVFLSFRFRTISESYKRMFPSLEVDVEGELARYKEYADKIRPLVRDTVSYLYNELQNGKKILVEGANAAMLDIDFGM